jgi:CO/xanthine dehydrogenase Mo-binding subunit
MFEELRVQDGRVVNALLADYKLPTAIDVPPLRTAFLIDTGGPGPFGAKMAGEAGNPGVAPALANAIADAAGARVTELPLTAERVFDALRRGAAPAPAPAAR